MTLFDWLLIIGFSITILLFISFFVFFFRNLILSGKIKKLKNIKRKNKKVKRELNNITKIKKIYIRRVFLSIIGIIIVGGSTFYLKWYQSTNLQDEDMDNLVFGYYLLNQVEEQLKVAEKDDSKKTEENIHSLALKISTYSSKSGSDRGTKESQVLLNRYYSRLGQFGVNVAAESFNNIKSNIGEYQEDIKNIKSVQKQALEYYKINEDSLKQKK